MRNYFRGSSINCYPIEDDLVVALEQIFSHEKSGKVTQFEIDKKEAELKSDEQRREEFLQNFGPYGC